MSNNVEYDDVTNNKSCALGCYQANKPVRTNRLRRCNRLISFKVHGSSESAYSSSGDEWQPPQSPTSSSLSNEMKIENQSPSATSSVPAGKSTTTNSAFSSINWSIAGLVIAPNAPEIRIPKGEREDHPDDKNSKDLEVQRGADLRDYPCDVCGKSFARCYELKRHIDCVHKSLRPYACEICGKTFKTMPHLKVHIDSLHKSLRPHACEICGRGFSEMKDLRNHINRLHKNLREHGCALCDKAFATQRDLKEHILRIHQKLREHSCGLCDKAFGMKHELNQHVLHVHQNLRDHSCGLCDKAFTKKQHLKEHVLRFHTDLREHSCGICKKAFVTKRELMRHVRAVHQKSSET